MDYWSYADWQLLPTAAFETPAHILTLVKESPPSCIEHGVKPDFDIYAPGLKSGACPTCMGVCQVLALKTPGT
eukprot:2621385-Karenia_brevis.AAC.1